MITPGVKSGRRSNAVPGATGWLNLAAAPAFTAMALQTYASGADATMQLCSASHGLSVLSGMAPMYVLMSAFHSMPWLNLIGRWRSLP
jgi:hypothetical protein